MPTGPAVNRAAPGLAWAAATVAFVFLAVHLPLLAPGLDDIDAVNFALAIRDFDPAKHQPHPPGYPVFVALAKLTTWCFHTLGIEKGYGPLAPRPEPMALSSLGVLFGALATIPLVRLYHALARSEPSAERRSDWPVTGALGALAAAAVTLACPLYCLTAARPLSDVPGLASALVAQALLLEAWCCHGEDGRRALRLVVAGSFVAALAAGLRSQTVWLTAPLVVLVALARFGRQPRALAATAGALASGFVAWAVPLVIASGGAARYLGALRGQGAEDFSGVDMLFTNPTPRRLAFGLYHTFVLPWASIPLAAVVLLLALVGVLALLRHGRPALVLLAVGFGPYAIFHVAFHETITTRYALPLVPPMVYLAWRGARSALGRWALAAPLALAVWAAVIGGTALARYAAAPAPIVRAIGDMVERASGSAVQPVVAMHRRIRTESRRAFEWELGGQSPFWQRMLSSPARYEWREVAQYWRGGGEAPVWFLANPARTDLALVDPASRRLVTAYRWPFWSEALAGNTRPGAIDWYDITLPGWFLGEGWSLTPETAGVAARDGRGPSRGPIEAWVRRRPGRVTLLIGGRHLGGSGTPQARLVVRIDGNSVLAEDIASTPPGFFLRLLPLPALALAGDGRFATLDVAAAGTDGQPAPPLAIEQFDVQDPDRAMFGFDAGWHEPEYNPLTGRAWRWTSEASRLRVRPPDPARHLRLRLIGESPLRYYREPPSIVVRAGTTTLATLTPSSDFDEAVTLPADALDRAGGFVTLTIDHTFVPDDREHNGDRRRLGVRIWSVAVEPAGG